MDSSKIRTFQDIVTEIQNNPNWIGYGLGLLVFFGFINTVASHMETGKPPSNRRSDD